ncbi:terminase small subunit [Sporosarcina sp. ANT_H38]|uniref:terminase small subunit n=1 Tax=Sporosarcina sp. ANT_H38 TaxID=2597358 RepID=UPI00165DCFE8
MSEGYRYLKDLKIYEEIDRKRNETLNEKKLGANGVLQKYIAFTNSSDFVERNDDYSVSLRRLEEMDTSIIAELSNTEKGVKLRTRSCSGIMMKIRLELSSSNERKQIAKKYFF